MSRSRFSVLVSATIAVAACNAAPPDVSNAAAAPVEAAPVASNQAAPAAAPDPSGSYNRIDPSNATLTIARNGANWTLTVGAAGIPNGASTAADCELVAAGPLVEGRIVGKLVRTEDTAYDTLAEESGGTLTAIVGDGSVALEEQGASSKHCGMGSDLTGTYTKG